VRITLKDFCSSGDRAAAVRITQEDVDEPPGYFRRDLPESHSVGACVGHSTLKSSPYSGDIFCKDSTSRYDRKPDRPAPIRVPSK